MKIAVTGATGFIGRAVLEELSRRGITAVGSALGDVSIVSELGHQPVSFDLYNPSADIYDRLGRPEVVIHLAWSGLPNYGSLHHFEKELPAQYLFLSGLIRAGLPSLVVAGTCFEYGMQAGALSEDLPTRPVTPYGFAKDALRRELEFLKSTHPFALIWMRIFYLYGQRQGEKALFSQLRKAVLAGQKKFDMSGGEQLRDYLPVEEAARLIVTLACSGRDAGIVNVCSGRPISVRRLVETWLRQYGWKIELNVGYYPYPEYEPMAFWGDRSKLDALLKCCE